MSVNHMLAEGMRNLRSSKWIEKMSNWSYTTGRFLEIVENIS